MALRIFALTLMMAATVGTAPVLAADDSGFSRDLKATIALQGMTCDQVINAKRNADSDYTATCKDGNRYHVYVNAQGRVIVQKL
jgi:hypothetical protein